MAERMQPIKASKPALQLEQRREQISNALAEQRMIVEQEKTIESALNKNPGINTGVIYPAT